MKKLLFHPIALVALALGLGVGSWGAYRGAIGCRIQSAFVGTVFCPVRAQYPGSILTDEEQVECESRQHSLLIRLRVYFFLLAAASVVSAVGSVGCAVLLIVPALRKKAVGRASSGEDA